MSSHGADVYTMLRRRYEYNKIHIMYILFFFIRVHFSFHLAEKIKHKIIIRQSITFVLCDSEQLKASPNVDISPVVSNNFIILLFFK